MLNRKKQYLKTRIKKNERRKTFYSVYMFIRNLQLMKKKINNVFYNIQAMKKNVAQAMFTKTKIVSVVHH